METRNGNRIKSCDYEWEPPHAAYEDLPPSTYKKETRTPTFLLFTKGSEQKGTMQELYFLNCSDETLDWVSSCAGGFQTCDDDVATADSNGYQYENVEPGEAVLIDYYDMIYDSDYLLQPQVMLSSPKLGQVKFLASPEKGGYKDAVLLWDTGEPHRGVTMKTLDSAKKASNP